MQNVKIDSSTLVQLDTNLLYTKVSVTSNVGGADSTLKWQPPSPGTGKTKVMIQQATKYGITHLSSGEYDGKAIPSANSIYKPSSAALNSQNP